MVSRLTYLTLAAAACVGSAAADSESVTITSSTDGALLGGTITWPAADGKHDCVLLVSGSGPNDQDSCTTYQPGVWSAPLLDLASTLPDTSAVLRVDKRTCNGAAGNTCQNALNPASLPMTDFDLFADDVLDAVDMLKATGRCNDRLTLVGHSYGGLYAAQAAARVAADADSGNPPMNVVAFMTPFIGPDVLLNLQMGLASMAAEQKVYDDIFAAADCDPSSASSCLADDATLEAFGEPSQAMGFYRGWLAAGRDGRIADLLKVVVDNGGAVNVINSPEDGKVWEATYAGLHADGTSFTSTVIKNVMHDGTPCVAFKATADNGGAGKIANSELKVILAAAGMGLESIPLQIAALDPNADDFVSADEVTAVMGVAGDYCQPLVAGRLSLCNGIGAHIGAWMADPDGTHAPLLDALADGGALCTAYTALESPATQADGCGAPEAATDAEGSGDADSASSSFRFAAPAVLVAVGTAVAACAIAM